MNLLTCGLLSLIAGCNLIAPVTIANDLESSSNAYEETAIVESIDVSETTAVEPRLFTTFEVAVHSSDTETGVVVGTVTNKFTLFSTTVTVSLYLYSSVNKTEDPSQMTLEGSAYIGDLDQGKSMSVSASTGGQAKYWLSVINYRINNGELKSAQSQLGYFDADGNEA